MKMPPITAEKALTSHSHQEPLAFFTEYILLAIIKPGRASFHSGIEIRTEVATEAMSM
jgi:hypothetical protein